MYATETKPPTSVYKTAITALMMIDIVVSILRITSSVEPLIEIQYIVVICKEQTLF